MCVPAYSQAGSCRVVLADYLSKHACFQHRLDTTSNSDVIANTKSPLTVRTAGGCLTKVSDYNYFYCYIMGCGSAETPRCLSVLPACVGRVCENYSRADQCALSFCSAKHCRRGQKRHPCLMLLIKAIKERYLKTVHTTCFDVKD